MGKGKRIILANGLKAIVGRSTRANVSCVESVTSEFSVSPSFCAGGSVRVRLPRNTMPGSKPSTNVAVTLTILSTLAGVPMEGGITVAKRVALEKEMLTINNVGRGLLTTRETKVAGMLLPGRYRTSLRRVPRGMGRRVRFILIRRVSRILRRTLLEGNRRW